MIKDFSKLCTPARVYFAIFVITTVIDLLNRAPFLDVGLKLIFAFIWTFALSWLCDKGYQNLSWFLVLLPYVILLVGVLGIIRIPSK
jgi:hypothetical protein